MVSREFAPPQDGGQKGQKEGSEGAVRRGHPYSVDTGREIKGTGKISKSAETLPVPLSSFAIQSYAGGRPERVVPWDQVKISPVDWGPK